MTRCKICDSTKELSKMMVGVGHPPSKADEATVQSMVKQFVQIFAGHKAIDINAALWSALLVYADCLIESGTPIRYVWGDLFSPALKTVMMMLEDSKDKRRSKK